RTNQRLLKQRGAKDGSESIDDTMSDSQDESQDDYLDGSHGENQEEGEAELELSIIASYRDPIEYSGVTPKKEEGDAQEKGPEVDDESQISGAEGKAALEDADENEKKEVKKGGSSVSVAHTVIA
ncbi:hypothetical protein BGZ89_005224, partial [Linnemannia elongata]